MSRRDELATVVELACLTEDRAPAEQRSLLAVALDVDKERARFTITNHDPKPPRLTALVQDTYDPSEGRRVDLSMAQAEQLNRLYAKWEPCKTCGKPVGAHALDECGAVQGPEDVASGL